MATITLTDITAGYLAATTINANNTIIEDAFADFALDPSGTETVTGSWTFTGTVDLSGATVVGGWLNNVVEDTTPQLGGTLDANSFNIDMGTNVITDSKVGQWDTAFGWGDHSTQGYLLTADLNGATLATADETITGSWTFQSTTGANITLQDSDDTGTSAVAWVRFEDSAGTRLGWVGFGSTGNSDAYLTSDSGNVRLFPNSGVTYNEGMLIVDDGGATPSVSALESALSSNFLHIDGKEVIDGNDSFLRLNQNNDFTGGIYSPGQIRTDNSLIIGATGNGLRSVTGTYGSVQTVGTGAGSYTGYSCDGLAVFMADPSGNAGLYNDQDDEWWLLGSRNAGLTAYYNGVVALRTKDRSPTQTSTAAEVIDPGGSWRSVGMNVMPRKRNNTSFTLTKSDSGGYFYSNDSTTYTITISSADDTFETEGLFFILNYGSGNVNVNTSGVNLLWGNGSNNLGNRVVGPYSVATILKYGTGTFFIWGDNIS